MKKRTDQIVQVTLIVKGTDPVDAEKRAHAELYQALFRWYVEDRGTEPPFPEGSLLWYGFHALTDNERETT